MGQIHSLVSRALSSGLSDEVPAPTFSTDVIFQSLETIDADALSGMLDASQFDLTTFDEVTGETVLHRAIVLGRADITDMLLHRAEGDPRVLNVQDRQGYTPLMLATKMQSVALMKALVDQGGRAGDSLTMADVIVGYNGNGKNETAVVPALMLIEAQGDISRAFGLAAQYRKLDVSKAYFAAGASTLFALQGGADTISWIFNFGCVRADDVFAALVHAQESGDAAIIASLTQPRHVLLSLDSIADRDDAITVAALERFIQAGANAEDLLSAAVSRCAANQSGWDRIRGSQWNSPSGSRDLDIVRLLVSIGVPIASELIRPNSDPDSAGMVEKLIGFRAASFGLMDGLRTANQRNEAVIATAAIAGFLQSPNFSEERKISELSVLFRDIGPDATDELARRWVRAGRSLDEVRLFLRAGAAPTERLLMALAETACKVGRRTQATFGAPTHAPERQFARELMHLGADGRSAVRQLLKASDIETGRRRNREATVLKEAARFIMQGALLDLLGNDLSNAEKVAALKQMMHEGDKVKAADMAGELLSDAVNARHWHTVKLMAIADVPATQAFVNLSKKILDGEKGAKTATGDLIRLGTDFRPAMAQLAENAKTYAEKGKYEEAKREQDALHALGTVIASELAPRGPGNAFGRVVPDQ